MHTPAVAALLLVAPRVVNTFDLGDMTDAVHKELEKHEVYRAAIDSKANATPATEQNATATDEPLEWGIRFDLSLDVTRVHIFNWPVGEHQTWPSRTPIKAPLGHKHDDPFDPHSPLKLFHSEELQDLVKETASYEKILEKVKVEFPPLIYRSSLWIPEDKHNTTLAMILIGGFHLRGYPEDKQCPFIYALRELIDASPFKGGDPYLISIPNSPPFHPRTCAKVKWGFQK